MNLPQVPRNLERAAAWSWRVLVCAAAGLAVLAVLWYLRVIVLPVMVALTIAPALTPVARLLRSFRLERPAAGLALLTGLAVVAGLIAIGYDGSPDAQRAIDVAGTLKAADALIVSVWRLTPPHVGRPYLPGPSSGDRHASLGSQDRQRLLL